MSGTAGIIQDRKTQSPYCHRKIFLDLHIDRREARFSIRDEGQGFDHKSVFISSDPASTDNLDMDRGRGLTLMRSFMDEVSYNDTGYVLKKSN